MKNNECEQCGGLKTLRWYNLRWRKCVCECRVRVSQLTEIELDQLSDDDCIMISDVSERKSKKITIGNLRKCLNKK